MSTRTHRTGRSSVPDCMRVQDRYTKAIEELKRRGEKGLLVQAMNEVGGVGWGSGIQVENGYVKFDKLNAI